LEAVQLETQLTIECLMSRQSLMDHQ